MCMKKKITYARYYEANKEKLNKNMDGYNQGPAGKKMFY